MIGFETDVRIDRPIDEVFAYVSDPLNFPRWNSAVQAVRTTSADERGVTSTYLMERELPSGRAANELEVVASESPREFTIRATAGPTPFLYRYRSLRRTAKQSSNSTPRSSYQVPQPSCRSWPGAQSRKALMTTSQL